MLILFFTIVFIAELIVGAKIVSVIKDANNTVSEINTQVVHLRPLIADGMRGANAGVKSAAKSVGFMTKFLETKKRAVIISLVKGFVGIVIFLMIKKYPNKRILSIIDMIYTVDNIMSA